MLKTYSFKGINTKKSFQMVATNSLLFKITTHEIAVAVFYCLDYATTIMLR